MERWSDGVLEDWNDEEVFSKRKYQQSQLTNTLNTFFNIDG